MAPYRIEALAPDRFGPADSGQRLILRVHVEDTIIHGPALGVADEVMHGHPFGHGFEEGTVFPLARFKGFLSPLELRDIRERDHYGMRFRCGLHEQGAGVDLDPVRLPVAMPDAHEHIVAGLPRAQGLHGRMVLAG